MMYKQIECPTCGNETTAKAIDEPQKCRWCRRLFKVNVTRRNKEGRKGKYNWSAEPVDFKDNHIKSPKNLEGYRNKDIYGK